MGLEVIGITKLLNAVSGFLILPSVLKPVQIHGLARAMLNKHGELFGFKLKLINFWLPGRFS